MKAWNDDPLLQALRGLPPPRQAPARRAATLSAAEAAFGKGNASSWRLPEIALTVVLAAATALYAAESMSLIRNVYGHAEVASVDSAK